MREMKDSGIRWIRDIPDNWKVLRVKDGFIQKKTKAHEENPVVLSLARSGVKVRNMDNAEGQFASSYYDYNPVAVNDMLINPMDLISGDNCSLSKLEGVISPAYVNLRYQKGFFPDYYQYYFKYQYWCKAFFAHGKGVSFDNRWTLNNETLMKFPLITPPLSEQQKIATFLDKKCSQIDSLRSDIEKQIVILEEYKKSVITEAVTKGLDPNVEMIDSGIEWIGKIPKDWEILPFKYVLHERTEKNNPIQSTERLSLSIDTGVTLYSEKTTNLDRFKENFAAYKLTHNGDLVMNSMNMIVGATGVSKYYGCVSPVYYTFYDDTKDNLYARYCEYIFKCRPMLRVLHSLGKGIYSIDRGDDRVNTCRLKVSRYDLNKIEIPIPSVDTVHNILNYLDSKCAQIDSTITSKKQQLETLDNYKKSLIYEYVTGKKEVPNE